MTIAGLFFILVELSKLVVVSLSTTLLI